MKKILLIGFLLLISISTFFVNNCAFSNEEMGVRDIYIENNDFDLSYLKNKYDIFNTENSSIYISETYNSSMSTISNTSSEAEYKIKYNVYINKIEKYFTFSYILYENEEISLTSSVNINIFEYDNKYYFLSSNGCVAACEEIYNISNVGNCATLSYKSLDNCIGLPPLINRFGFGGGGAGLGLMIGIGAGIALIDAAIDNSNSSSISCVGGSTSSCASSGSLPPNNNNKKNDKDKTKDLSDEISDDYKTNGKCDQYADALESKMKENKISGERIKVTPKTGKDIIYSDKYGVIGENGYHDAIKVGDYIFDNMNPKGVPYSEWVLDLGGDIYNLFETIRSW